MASAPGEAPLTETLAEFVAGFHADEVPRDVVERTLGVVLDGTGALLAATNPAYATGRLIADFVEERAGKPESTVVGGGFRTGCVDAALANGTMGYACDIEPYHPEAILHPIAVLVPAALAVGERTGASGRAFLAAVALGCEVEYRISMALGPAAQYALGFHPSAVCGCFGAAAAAAYLLGLGAEAVIRAFGLAGCQASGLMAWESDSTENARPFQMGMAARNGITAALLAERGFGGPVAIFDKGHTIFHAFSRAARPAALTRDLGKTYDGVMGLALKPFACVAFLHPGLDALIEILREHDLGPDDVEGLVMRFARSGVHCVDGNPLKSHCAQYILPVAVADRTVGVDAIFADRRLLDPKVAELARRTQVVADDGELEAPFPDRYATVIEVTTRAGRMYSKRNDIARSNPESPMSEADVTAKFTALASSVATADRIAALIACLGGLDQATGLEEYAGLLGRPAETIEREQA